MLKTNIADRDLKCMSIRGKWGILLNDAYRLIEEMLLSGSETTSHR